MMFKSVWSFLKTTFSEYKKDNVSTHAAALAYYAIFAIAPLFVIAIAIAGFVLGEQAAQGEIVGQLEGVVGERGAQVIESMIAGARKPSTGIVATALSTVALLFGTSGIFVQLKGSLNLIWEVEPRGDRGIMGTIKDRLFAVLLVLLVGVFLLALMIGSSVLWALTSYFQGVLPLPPIFWQIVVNFLAPLAILTMVFGFVLKVIPNVKIAWKDVWVGAAATAFLFTVGQFLLGLYLGRSSFSSTYGLAGAVLLILVWIYYSAQIFLLGAEITQVYARRYGAGIEPSENAVVVRKETRTEKKKAA